MLIWIAAGGLGWADVPQEDRWLESARAAVGVNVDGSLINEELDLGLLWDPPGSPPMGDDLLAQGDEFEVWSASYTTEAGSASLVNGASSVGSDLVFSWELDLENPMAELLHGVGEGDALAVETWVVLSRDEDLLWFSLAFTAREAVGDLAVARVLDLDPDVAFSGEHNTANRAGDGFAVAAGLWDGRALAMASPGGTGGICAWCTLSAEVLAGEAGPSEGDDQIGLAVSLGDLAAGETATVTFAYALAMDADEAVAMAETAAATPAWDVEYEDSGSWTDDDGDGSSEAEGDCDDGDAAVYPGASAVSGVADADCDGARDDGSWDTAADTAGVDLKSGGCATAGGRAPGAALWMAGLLLIRRRRRL